MYRPGYTYYEQDVSGKKHLWIVLTFPSLDFPKCVLCVNVSTNAPRKDQTCILTANCHRAITRDSVVMYIFAKLERVKDLEEREYSGKCTAGLRMELEIVDKIQQGLLQSKMTPKKCKDFLRDILNQEMTD